jgi:hypothetical protein
MSLTVNTVPANISNSGAFNVTTSLTESSPTCVNLRVRCDITVASVIVATVEKPKGIADFDFFDILKSNVSGISFSRDSGDLVKVSGGSPLVAYTVLFTEVYENAGATTTGDTDNAGGVTFKFVPAIGDGSFAESVLHDATSLFACKTLRNNVTKFYLSSPSEYWIVFFTEVVHCELFYSKDGGAYDHATHFDPASGWGAIILNVGELMSGVTSNLRIQIGEVGGAKISEVMTIYIDSSAIDARVVLEYDGLTGGKEYLSFEGMKAIDYTTYRSYYTGASKAKKALSYFGVNRQKIETRFPDMNNAEYLKSLLISETVKRMELSYLSPTDVTILTDSVKISNSEMFTNQLEIEY